MCQGSHDICHREHKKISLSFHYIICFYTLSEPSEGQKVVKGWGIRANTISLLICTLKSDFEGGRKVVLQIRILFFSGWGPRKKI